VVGAVVTDVTDTLIIDVPRARERPIWEKLSHLSLIQTILGPRYSPGANGQQRRGCRPTFFDCAR
jgi:hypothetical protein